MDEPLTISEPDAESVLCESTQYSDAFLPPNVVATSTDGTSASNTRSFIAPGSLKSSVFSLTSATMGAGTISVAYAFYSGGILYSIFILLVLAYFSVDATKCTVRAMEYSQLKTYEEAAVSAKGNKFAQFVEINMIFFCFGACVAYIVTIGDILKMIVTALKPHLPASRFLLFIINRNHVLLSAFVIFILLPMCMAKKLSSLRFVSILGVIGIALLVVTLFITLVQHAIHKTLHFPMQLLYPPTYSSIVTATSIFLFSFACQPNVPNVYRELQRASIRRMKKVALRSCMTCIFFYGSTGLLGVIIFQNKINGNILTSLFTERFSNYFVYATLLGMSLTVSCAYPLNIQPCRFSLETALLRQFPDLQSNMLSKFLSVILVMLSLIIAISLPYVTVVFELVGSSSGAFINLILPGCLAISLLPGPLSLPEKRKGLILICVGILCAILGTVKSIFDVIAAENHT